MTALRFTLLGVFAAAGIGIAVSLALRMETPAGLGVASAASQGEQSPTRIASAQAPDSRNAPSTTNPVRRAPTPKSVPADAPNPKPPQFTETATNHAIPTPEPNSADGLHQLTIAHQMGRLEEKLRRAEESAERQQRSLELVLTTFEQQRESAAQTAVLHRQDATSTPDQDVSLPTADGAMGTPSAPSPSGAPSPTLEVLPPPLSPQAGNAISEEGDGLLTLNLKNSDLRQVLELLSEQHGLNIIASGTVQGAVTARLTNVDVHTALDAVLRATGFVARPEGNVIYVATPAEFLAMDHAHDQIGTRVYRPNYITASEMQRLLTPLMTPEVGVIAVSTAAKVGLPADSVDAGGDSFSGAEVVLVQDYESVLKRIDQLLLEVDVRPLQVSIEAMIINVTLDDQNRTGVNFALLRDEGDSVIVSGGPVKNLPDIAFDGGLKFGFLDSSLAVFIEALETIGDTNVVAAPRVMVLNKQRAEVLIGSQLGYVSTTVTENAATQSVEFLEVGTQLRIRPFIASDGTIRLEVHPELSTGAVDVRDGFTLPNKSVTQVTTNIMCHDGATVVIGGLIREDLASNTTQIPVLGALPWVGAAFRQRREQLARRETLVLLTPRIVSIPVAAAEGAQGKNEYLRRQDVRYDKMSPLAQRYYGKQYLRKARAAWLAGDASVALRFANLAIHFDPESLEAINLRSEIVANSPYGDRSVESHLREGLAPWKHPLRDYSSHGYPWQSTEEPTLMSADLHDPGMPGEIRKLGPQDAAKGFPIAVPNAIYPRGPVEEIPALPPPNASTEQP